MSQIPITKEYAEAVGSWCEKVENRSLLHEKFAFPKKWGDSTKEDQASNWSLMRIASNGSTLLHNAQKDLERKANNPEKAENMKSAAKVCAALSATNVGSKLDSLRPQHSVRFIELLRANYTEKRLRIVEGRLEGRLAINLAEGVIQNAGINLDRIFGLPLIPGSAIKGVTRSVALQELNKKKDTGTFELFARVFGLGKSEFEQNGELAAFTGLLEQTNLPKDEKKNKVCRDLKGSITFIQSTPSSNAQIVVDITNVHTPDYYQHEGLLAKADKEKNQSKKLELQEKAESVLKQKENPRPNYFPAVERGAEFAFPLLLNSMNNDTELLDVAERWLKTALEQHGIGAKIAAGYGWFSVFDAKNAELTYEEQSAPAENEAELTAKFKELKDDDFRAELNRFRGGVPKNVTKQYARILRNYAKSERASLLTGKAAQAIVKLEELG